MHTRTIALTAAAALACAAPVAAQPSSQWGQSQSQQAGGQMQTIEQQDLEKYVQALQRMAQFEPGIQTALERGQPVETDLLDKVPREQAQEAMRQAGLSSDEFQSITEQLRTDEQAKQQFSAVAQEQVRGSVSGSSGSGQQPGGSGQQPQGQK